jgi:hypothetical protein
MTVARETKSPTLERVAVWAMIASAIMGMTVAALHAVHVLKKDFKDDRRDKEKDRDRQSDAPATPERSAQGRTAPAGIPALEGEGDSRRWTRREERSHAGHAYARHR